MGSCPTVFWHELDGKVGHVGAESERLRKASVTYSPVPQSGFPMAHNSLPPDLIENPGASLWMTSYTHARILQQISVTRPQSPPLCSGFVLHIVTGFLRHVSYCEISFVETSACNRCNVMSKFWANSWRWELWGKFFTSCQSYTCCIDWILY